VTARAFLFIHGFGGAGIVWQKQMDHFKAFAPATAVDLPGHGGAPWSGEGLDAMAARVLSGGVREGTAVVASSFGGLVALKLWEKAPQMFTSITFAGSMPRFTACDGFPAGLDQERIRKLSGQLQGDTAAVMEMFFRSLFTRQEREGASYREVKTLLQKIPVPSQEALQGFLDILASADLRDILKTVDVPVRFILGDGDPICPVVVAGPVKALCPTARVDVMSGCGHFPFLSKPDEFNVLLRELAG
jgi:pimeloyl-ACP methyl ester esterase